MSAATIRDETAQISANNVEFKLTIIRELWTVLNPEAEPFKGDLFEELKHYFCKTARSLDGLFTHLDELDRKHLDLALELCNKITDLLLWLRRR